MNIIFYIFCTFFLNNVEIKSAKVNIIDDSEQKYNNVKYLNSYSIPYSMMLFRTNGNSFNNDPLRNAFDGNFDTYWQSLIPQEDSFINYIEIIFSKTVSFDRIIYQAPSFEDIIGDGYPIELKIYIKLRNSDNNINKGNSEYLLVNDIISERTGKKVVFILEQVIECDQIKLEWSQIEKANYTSDYIYASASEIILLFPENEYLNKLLFEVFDENDYSKMIINSEYNDLLVIQEIEENLQNYLYSYNYIKELIERAKQIIEGKIKYEKRREFTTNPQADINRINQYGDIFDYTKQSLKMSRGGTNRQPTGIFAFSGETISIFVESNDNDPLPNIIFTQYIGLYNNWMGNKFQLKKGINILTVNDFNITLIKEKVRPGGPIYIENKYTPDEQSQNIKIYIEGGILFPLFRINDNEEEFKKTLNDYINEYNKNEDNFYNIAEFYSDKIMITINATYANDIYNNKGESPQKNLVNWNKMIKILYTFDGIQFEPNQPYYNKLNEYIKLHIRYSTKHEPKIGAYAADEHIGIFNQFDFDTCLVSYKEIGKTMAHEIGHMIGVIYREFPEKTNCVLEEYTVQVLYKDIYKYTLKNMEILYSEIAPDTIDNSLRNCGDNKPNCKGFFINSGNYKYAHYMWWAIESFYPGYWGKLNNLYRYNKELYLGMNINEAMVFLTSLVLGYNMEYYFERFGLAMTNEIVFNKSDTSETYKNKLEQAIEEGKIKTGIYKKLWYADIEQYNYSINNGTGCYKNENDYEIKIIDTYKDETSGIYLTFELVNCPGHLGFEIIENDVIIGFTNKRYFVDKKEYPSDYKPRYKIIAYDRLLYSKESDYIYIE